MVREAQEKGVGVTQSIVTKYSGPVLGTSTMVAEHQEIDLRPTRKLSLLSGFHNPRRCSANCWGREAANSPVERGPLQAATLTCQQRCTHVCDRDRRFGGDIQFLLKGEEQFHAWCCKPRQKPMAWELICPRGVILINDHNTLAS